ncbi:MAG: hypothetical protein NTW21_13540 [Verrucomicrobia bacterium]|nr:hypothetical protein [Verrucomicrobiota bacterium]
MLRNPGASFQHVREFNEVGDERVRRAGGSREQEQGEAQGGREVVFQTRALGGWNHGGERAGGAWMDGWMSWSWLQGLDRMTRFAPDPPRARQFVPVPWWGGFPHDGNFGNPNQSADGAS